ncbi:hypothetical protein Drorol1_Dr00013539 [Drosera rotundifolia]
MAQVLDVQVDFTHKSARVKSLDVHPTNPWILTSLHSRTVSIFDYKTKVVLKSIDITHKPGEWESSTNLSCFMFINSSYNTNILTFFLFSNFDSSVSEVHSKQKLDSHRSR